MGIRVLRPDGVLEDIDKIVPYAERSGVWNGKARRRMERAAGIDEANALIFTSFLKACTIGNLSPEQILQIQREAAETGFLDATKLGCRVLADGNAKTVIGAGSDKPYFVAVDGCADQAKVKWQTGVQQPSLCRFETPTFSGFCEDEMFGEEEGDGFGL